jgi:hypothetical protein
MSSRNPSLLDRARHRIAFERQRHRLERDFARLHAGREVSRAHAGGAGPVIGFVTLASGGWHFALEALLAHALAQRGARPELLMCDMPDLPICSERRVNARNRDRCAGCIEDKRSLVASCGLPWRPLRSLVAPETLSLADARIAALGAEELAAYEERGWPLGQWLHVSASHYLGGDALGNTPEKVDARRRLLTSGIVFVEAIERWLDEVRPDIVIAQGGAHLEWRITMELARARGISVTCREMGKGGWDHHIYALNADSMSPDLTEEWSIVRRRPLSDSAQLAVDSFLRELPARTYRQTADQGRAGHSARQSMHAIPPDKRIAVAFTNVTWDLATAGRDVAFSGVFDWLRETIRILSAHPNVHLIVRAHPAEASVRSRERILDQVSAHWPAGLPGITLIDPEAPIAARELCERADLVLAYNSTAGLEAAAYGSNVLVCGKPHYRGKGFTLDISSMTEYADTLKRWAAGPPPVMPAGAAELAQRYVHLFYLRYHIKMGWTTSELEPPFELTIRSLQDLQPGRNPSLDAVCDGILERRQILLPRQAFGETR